MCWCIIPKSWDWRFLRSCMISFSIVICSFKLFISNGSFGHFWRAALATSNFFLKSSFISKSSPCKLQMSQQQLKPQFNNFSLLESRNNDADSMSKYWININQFFNTIWIYERPPYLNTDLLALLNIPGSNDAQLPGIFTDNVPDRVWAARVVDAGKVVKYCCFGSSVIHIDPVSPEYSDVFQEFHAGWECGQVSKYIQNVLGLQSWRTYVASLLHRFQLTLFSPVPFIQCGCERKSKKCSLLSRWCEAVVEKWKEWINRQLIVALRGTIDVICISSLT